MKPSRNQSSKDDIMLKDFSQSLSLFIEKDRFIGTIISIDDWLLKRKNFDINDSLDAIEAILDELIKNPKNKLSSDTIYRQEIREDDTIDIHYSIGCIEHLYANDIEKKVSQVADLSKIFMRILIPNATKEHSSAELIKMLNELLFMLWNDYSVSIPENIDLTLQNDLIVLFSNMSNSNPVERPTLEFIQAFFASIKHRRELVDKISTYNHIIKEINYLYQLFGTNSCMSPLEIQSHITTTIDSLDNKKPLDTMYCDYSINDLDIITSKKDDLSKLYNGCQKAFAQFSTAKFEGTNSDGIKKIQAILANPDKTIIDKIDEMRRIGKYKTENTLSNWMKRHSFFGQGRHKNIETLYQSLANIKLDPNTAKSDLTNGNLETIISTINKLLESNEPFVSNPMKAARAHFKV